MKQEDNHIDDLLRVSLEGYSKPPSPRIWRNISLSLLIRGRGIYLSAIILIIAAGSLYLFQPRENKLITAADLPVAPGQQEQAGSPAPAGPAEEPGKKTGQATVHQPEENTPAEKSQVLGAGIPKKSSVENNTFIPYPELGYAAMEHASSLSKQFTVYPGLERMARPDFPQIAKRMPVGSPPATGYPGEINPRHLYGMSSPIGDYGFKKSRGLMLQVMPELIFSGDRRQYTSRAINADLSFILEGREAFIQAGAGVGFSQDDGLFYVNYEQYDSIGFYERVNSFTLDPTSGLPVFNTMTEGVFDTVNYGFQETSKNRYTYFRIPVTAGLKVYAYRRFALFAEIGATYSVLMKKHEPGVSYTNNRATWIEIVDRTPARVVSNLQLSAGMGLKYGVSDRFDLRLDAMYNHYWNAIMERQGQLKSPFSAGIKAGIIFKL